MLGFPDLEVIRLRGGLDQVAGRVPIWRSCTKLVRGGGQAGSTQQWQ